MQSYTEIPDSTQLKDSLSPILNNDKTALSNSSGTVFPTTNLQIGMSCYRSDTQKLYLLQSTSPSVWTLYADLTKAPVETDGSGNAGVSGTFTANALSASSLAVNGAANFKLPVTIKTAGYTLTAADSNGVFHNQGASGPVGFQLPSSPIGNKYTFVVHDAQQISAIAAAGHTIRNGTEVTATGGNLAASAVGSVVTVIGITSTEWFVEHITGAWTVT